MLASKKSALGPVSQSRTALAVVAATLLFGGGITEASAKSRHHHGTRHHYRHHASSDRDDSSHDAGASAGPFAGISRIFSGLASYYGNESGSRTASGERFNQSAMTCAHRSLPFGTKLRVTHGGRSVVVTVNDRGPFVRGRVLDLSTAAARAIGLTAAGVGRVTAEVLS
ncbi:septal ring lytic transglycosylase RlpA family protein [Bradyrhizobium sp. dw_78]|uniref:septal ring lytic transglycosylase RlpA family protein n=1 Tax=Bradyrhizobium sp. dw_78 TaxID=2719793 RepID=UPI001BD205BE|nr:septal ring lytic transglycosylase RlpA family protein [Bradyrhizobium sp. dw_78]